MNEWKNGIYGVIVGDALGTPVQFESRSEVMKHPIKDMRGYGTFNLPEGSWTDDSSLTLATLDALIQSNFNMSTFAHCFADWYFEGKYTPFGYSFDIGIGTSEAIKKYAKTSNPFSGGTDESNNGNGSLMRILPICLFNIYAKADDYQAIKNVHDVSAITHGHLRSQIACGLYYFIVKEILTGTGVNIQAKIDLGLRKGFAHYDKEANPATARVYNVHMKKELAHFEALRSPHWLILIPEKEIKSTGYVVDTLVAAIWSLMNTDNYKDALLTAVNLGEDTDTVGAVTGGLAGLYYGIGDKVGIPKKWINALQNGKLIEELITKAENELKFPN